MLPLPCSTGSRSAPVRSKSHGTCANFRPDLTTQKAFACCDAKIARVLSWYMTRAIARARQARAIGRIGLARCKHPNCDGLALCPLLALVFRRAETDRRPKRERAAARPF